MPRTVLLTLGIQLLLTGVWMALPPEVAVASSGKIIYSFAGGADGALPYSDLIIDAAGNLYGTTNAGGGAVGCGTVFELTRARDGWKHQVLYSFGNSSNDGCGPTAGLVFDSAGNLYGTTARGGPSNCYGDSCGTVFKLAPNSHGGWTESILYSFTGSNGDGANPNTDLVFDNRGNLYGATSSGGGFSRGCFLGGCGTIFTLTPNQDGTWTESTIYAFAGVPKDGGYPASAVVLDANGNIYGTTSYGGTETCAGGPVRGCGSIYKLTPNSGGGWTEALLYNFHRFQGTARYPSGGFLLTSDGRILGTSVEGGDKFGAVFQVEQTKKGWKQTVLYRFYGTPDGEYPVGRLAMGPHGVLYGATASGGGDNPPVGGGAVFELEQANGRWKERVLFSANNAAYDPQAGPTVDSQGHVYGTLAGASYAGNFGAVYEIIP
jgi:uncharacterized repeat protein (TIGR03803 family)